MAVTLVDLAGGPIELSKKLIQQFRKAPSAVAQVQQESQG